MALSFLKKVFTFGKDKPAEAEPAGTPAADAVMDQAESTFSPEETRTIEAGLEPQSGTEDLPVAEDAVLPEEMDTAGGPSADTLDAPETEDETVTSAEEVDVTPAILPAVEEIGDIGLIPLSLLEAEAEATEIEESSTPPSVQEPVLGLAEGKTRGLAMTGDRLSGRRSASAAGRAGSGSRPTRACSRRSSASRPSGPWRWRRP